MVDRQSIDGPSRTLTTEEGDASSQTEYNGDMMDPGNLEDIMDELGARDSTAHTTFVN